MVMPREIFWALVTVGVPFTRRMRFLTSAKTAVLALFFEATVVFVFVEGFCAAASAVEYVATSADNVVMSALTSPKEEGVGVATVTKLFSHARSSSSRVGGL